MGASLLRQRFYEPPANLVDAGTWIANAHGRCQAAGEGGERCLAAARPVLEDLHKAQARVLLGAGACPPGSVAVMVDRMPPTPVYPMCVRTAYNKVDDELMRLGSWDACKAVAELLLKVGKPGCHVFDIGANIGACTLQLALLGHRVTAFEPLPGNVALLKASLRLGAFAERQDLRSRVNVHQVALGESEGVGFILEGRGNAGMSVVVPSWPVNHCDPGTFHCDRVQKVPLARLDDLVQAESGDICLAKVDVEGAELRTFRGALDLLRSRRLRAMYIEWWPPHLRSMGEEPVALLWMLHALRYEIFVPAWWLHGDRADVRWLMAVPDQFPKLLTRWGDLLARAAPW
eukprot:TRINITY_DN27910_c0_g1_i1.p1 TRINITY_DN27910_c0_g1~~TRINITY_DN27910_c0_g1_i1.p1  ORF type:complete len:346 (-),score=79.71 TRINITY_DN27910_c0_g1_i1:123-1160(-)